jgi:hypothetical protein
MSTTGQQHLLAMSPAHSRPPRFWQLHRGLIMNAVAIALKLGDISGRIKLYLFKSM